MSLVKLHWNAHSGAVRVSAAAISHQPLWVCLFSSLHLPSIRFPFSLRSFLRSRALSMSRPSLLRSFLLFPAGFQAPRPGPQRFSRPPPPPQDWIPRRTGVLEYLPTGSLQACANIEPYNPGRRQGPSPAATARSSTYHTPFHARTCTSCFPILASISSARLLLFSSAPAYPKPSPHLTSPRARPCLLRVARWIHAQRNSVCRYSSVPPTTGEHRLLQSQVRDSPESTASAPHETFNSALITRIHREPRHSPLDAPPLLSVAPLQVCQCWLPSEVLALLLLLVSVMTSAVSCLVLCIDKPPSTCLPGNEV